MHGTIVVGVDGTEPSRAALYWGMRQAEATGARLRLVNVVGDQQKASTIRQDRLVDARRFLEREAIYAGSVAPGVVVDYALLDGDLIDELVTTSENSDLIALGTHKTGFIHGRVFGSRSLQLAAAARCPVAIIPQWSRRDTLGVVVGVGESDAGRSAIRFAAAEAHRRRQPLTLLRACDATQLPDDCGDEQRNGDSSFDEQTKTVLGEAAKMARSTHPDLEVRTRSVLRAAAEALLDASGNADLLVVGSSRREGSAQGLGPVSHDVLMNLVGPTVVVHGSDSAMPV
jgi:nucleotide-binding universal stress UspA family protein